MNKITERQWKDFSEVDAVKETKVAKTPKGYIVVLVLKTGEYVVCTKQYKNPRYWMSVDWLILHIKKVAPKTTCLNVILTESMDYEQDST